MTENALSQTDSRGVWNWIKENVLGWFLPAGLVGLGAGFISERFGDDIPEWARPITNILAAIWNWFIGLFRGFVAKEELQAEQGMIAQIDRHRIFEQAASEVDDPALATQLRDLVRERARADTGMSMTVDTAYALEQAKALFNEVYAKVNEALIRQNPNYDASPNSADRRRFDETARRYARAISGINDPEVAPEDINYVTHTAGYLGMLLHTQRGVAADTGTDFAASQVQPFNPQIMAAATDAAHPEVTQTPEGQGSAPLPRAVDNRSLAERV